MDWREYIHSDTEILLGKPVIKGTRISIELILELLSQGWSHEQLLESYPQLTSVHLNAVYAFLHESIGLELYFPLPKGA